MLTRRVLVTGLLATRALGRDTGWRFVLVPGAWHGAWAWERVSERLQRAGHEVEAVTLPGLSERADAGAVTLADHVQDVTSRLERAGERVVLVGHSYAGVVVTAAAARATKAVRLLVYLDAFIPEPGDSMLGLMKPAYSESWRRRASGGLVPPMLDAKAMGVSDAADRRWVDGRLTPHPLATLEEAVRFEASALEAVPRRYVWCSRYPGFKRYADKARRLGFDVRSLDAGHDAMITHPSELAAAIVP